MEKLTQDHVVRLLRSILGGIRRYHQTRQRQKAAGHDTAPELDDVILAGLISAYSLGLEHGRGHSLTDHDRISSYLERNFTQELLGLEDNAFVHHLVGPTNDN